MEGAPPALPAIKESVCLLKYCQKEDCWRLCAQHGLFGSCQSECRANMFSFSHELKRKEDIKGTISGDPPNKLLVDGLDITHGLFIHNGVVFRREGCNIFQQASHFKVEDNGKWKFDASEDFDPRLAVALKGGHVVPMPLPFIAYGCGEKLKKIDFEHCVVKSKQEWIYHQCSGQEEVFIFWPMGLCGRRLCIRPVAGTWKEYGWKSKGKVYQIDFRLEDKQSFVIDRVLKAKLDDRKFGQGPAFACWHWNNFWHENWDTDFIGEEQEKDWAQSKAFAIISDSKCGRQVLRYFAHPAFAETFWQYIERKLFEPFCGVWEEGDSCILIEPESLTSASFVATVFEKREKRDVVPVVFDSVNNTITFSVCGKETVFWLDYGGKLKSSCGKYFERQLRLASVVDEMQEICLLALRAMSTCDSYDKSPNIFQVRGRVEELFLHGEFNNNVITLSPRRSRVYGIRDRGEWITLTLKLQELQGGVPVTIWSKNMGKDAGKDCFFPTKSTAACGITATTCVDFLMDVKRNDKIIAVVSAVRCEPVSRCLVDRSQVAVALMSLKEEGKFLCLEDEGTLYFDHLYLLDSNESFMQISNGQGQFLGPKGLGNEDVWPLSCRDFVPIMECRENEIVFVATWKEKNGEVIGGNNNNDTRKAIRCERMSGTDNQSMLHVLVQTVNQSKDACAVLVCRRTENNQRDSVEVLKFLKDDEAFRAAVWEKTKLFFRDDCSMSHNCTQCASKDCQGLRRCVAWCKGCESIQAAENGRLNNLCSLHGSSADVKVDGAPVDMPKQYERNRLYKMEGKRGDRIVLENRRGERSLLYEWIPRCTENFFDAQTGIAVVYVFVHGSDFDNDAEVIYTIDASGALCWRNVTDLSVSNPSVIARDWNKNYKFVFAGEPGTIFALTQGGELRMFRLLSRSENTVKWEKPEGQVVSSGWEACGSLFYFGNRILLGGILRNHVKSGVYYHSTPSDNKPALFHFYFDIGSDGVMTCNSSASFYSYEHGVYNLGAAADISRGLFCGGFGIVYRLCGNQIHVNRQFCNQDAVLKPKVLEHPYPNRVRWESNDGLYFQIYKGQDAPLHFASKKKIFYVDGTGVLRRMTYNLRLREDGAMCLSDAGKMDVDVGFEGGNWKDVKFAFIGSIVFEL